LGVRVRVRVRVRVGVRVRVRVRLPTDGPSLALALPIASLLCRREGGALERSRREEFGRGRAEPGGGW
jgi:hypothetical protein